MIDKEGIDRNYLEDVFILGTPVLIIPFVYIPQLLDPALIPKFLATAIYLLIFLLLVIKKIVRSDTGLLSAVENRFFFFYLLYFLIAGISLIYTSNFAEGFFEWLKIGLALIFLVLLVLYYNDSEDFEFNIAKAITYFSIIISTLGLIHFLVLSKDGVLSHDASFHLSLTFAHKNLFAQILCLTIPFSLYYSLRSESWRRLIAILSLAFTLTLIIVCLSRTVWLALVIGTCCTAVIYLVVERKNHSLSLSNAGWKRLMLIFIAPVLVIGFIMSVYSEHGQINTIKKQFLSISNPYHGSAKDRIQLWGKTAQLIQENPLLGSGLASWEIEVLKHGAEGMKSEDGIVFYQRPHNDFIWVLSEMGIVGLACYGLIFLVLIGYIIKIIQRFAGHSAKLFYYLLLFGLFEYVIIASFSFPKERMEHALLLALIMAPILIKRNQLAHDVQGSKMTPLKLGTILAAVLLFIAIGVGLRRMMSEYHVKKALSARAYSDFEQTIIEIDEAESIFYTLDPMSTPISWYRGAAYFRLGNIQEAFQDFEESYKLHPNHMHCINNLATSYELLGNRNEAIRLYNDAIHLYPRFEDSRINLSIIYYNESKYSTAYTLIRNIIEDSKDPKVQVILNKALLAIVDSIQDTVSGVELKDLLEKIKNDEKWMRAVHFESIKNKHPFKHQLFMDVSIILDSQ